MMRSKPHYLEVVVVVVVTVIIVVAVFILGATNIMWSIKVI